MVIYEGINKEAEEIFNDYSSNISSQIQKHNEHGLHTVREIFRRQIVHDSKEGKGLLLKEIVDSLGCLRLDILCSFGEFTKDRICSP